MNFLSQIGKRFYLLSLDAKRADAKRAVEHAEQEFNDARLRLEQRINEAHALDQQRFWAEFGKIGRGYSSPLPSMCSADEARMRPALVRVK